jgi:predicted ABC-type ATPase
MGEKGIGGAADVAANGPGASSLIERTTTSVLTSVTGVGADLMTTVQEKAVGAFADEAIKAAREDVHRRHHHQDPHCALR